MSAELLSSVEIEPAGPVRSSVIWLHGLGADGHDFGPIVPHLGVEDLGVRFVFPHAPSIPVTINMGFVMPAWYDILGTDLRTRHDEGGIRRSAQQVEALIAREKERGVAAGQIVLAGFSQGGAMALHTALRHPEPLAGILVLSAYLLLPETLDAERNAANADTPVFQAHGTQDPMVAIGRGHEARDFLTAAGYSVEWHEYPMQHEVCMPEIEDVGRWLRQRLETAASSAE